ncbi:hypothetical protein, variant [Aphanomyces invadans]|uniref:Kinesin-like protein n=1 Tax=Aphanomyces invadans TaxID=157072 RepID=A0A024TJ02_9STRA|nr:hypothetical protein, variant [Aphanomyces invadans]ETV93939.1 hypothetical protein, variant [Aphanomyces invadans]|eukprot:XP_008877498.1 hypothetical protein, variant [Aphanomyces invadans]
MAGTSGGERIQVAIRARPTKHGDASSLTWRSNTLYIQADSCDSAASFRCDRFIDSTMTQDEAFAKSGVASLVQSALDGYSCTVFAYGQTGAGKSFTIFGPDQALVQPSDLANSTQGILPRSVAVLMASIHAANNTTSTYVVRVACVEIYNDQVYDLMAAKAQYATNSTLSIRWNRNQGFHLDEATIASCNSYEDMMAVILQAASKRIYSSHNLNERSNRSHCLVTIYIDSTDATKGRRCGKLTVVDLAGSERAHETGAVGTQLKESGHINKSLYCLSQVILALNAGKVDKFIPYRDSKLTTLLIDSLGGTSRTLMLACVNANVGYAKETIRTLEFAMGVARIRNRPTAILNAHDNLVAQLRVEIEQLKMENHALRCQATIAPNLPKSIQTYTAISATDETTSDACTSGWFAPTPQIDTCSRAIETNTCSGWTDDGPFDRTRRRRKPHKTKTLPRSFDQGNPYNPMTPPNHTRLRERHKRKLLPSLKSLSTPSLVTTSTSVELEVLPSLTKPKSTPLLPAIQNTDQALAPLPNIDQRPFQVSDAQQENPSPWELRSTGSEQVVRLKPITPRDEWEDRRAHDLFLQLCSL